MRFIRHRLLYVAIACGAAVGAHKMQMTVDSLRRADVEKAEYTFVPSPSMMKIASLGYHTMMSDLMWIRTVLNFIPLMEAPTEEGHRWFRAMLATVSHLDPRWRTPYFYGGGMLRVMADIEGSDEVYSTGMEALPDDHFFPFSLAMNAYLYHQDVDLAVDYMAQASNLESAPQWYSSAAAAFIHEAGRRDASLRYLREQLAVATAEKERSYLLRKYKTVLHEKLADALEQRREIWENTHRRPLSDLAALGALPEDPYDNGWIIAIDGAIRSRHVDLMLAERAKLNERSTLTLRWQRLQ